MGSPRPGSAADDAEERDAGDALVVDCDRQDGGVEADWRPPVSAELEHRVKTAPTEVPAGPDGLDARLTGAVELPFPPPPSGVTE